MSPISHMRKDLSLKDSTYKNSLVLTGFIPSTSMIKNFLKVTLQASPNLRTYKLCYP